MPGVMLNIGANVKPAVDGIKQVSLSLKEQQGILQKLRYDYALMSTAQRKSFLGKEMAADIRIANAEVQKLKAQSGSAFGVIGKGASSALGSMRLLANILPGMGIAGLFAAAGAGVAWFAKEVTKSISSVNGLTSAVKEQREAFLSAVEGSTKEVVRLQLLYEATQNTTLSIKERSRATKQFLEINEQNNLQTGKAVKFETDVNKILIANKTAYDELTKSVFKLAYTKAFTEQITKAQAKLIEEQTKALDEQTSGIGNLIRRIGIAMRGFGSMSSEAINRMVKGINVGEAKVKVDRLRELFKEGLKSGDLDISGLFDDIKPPPKSKIEKEIRAALGTIKLEIPAVLSIKEQEDIANKSSLQKEIERITKGLKAEIPVTLNLSAPGEGFQSAQENAKGVLEKMRDGILNVKDAISRVLTPAFEGFTQALFAGQNAFKAFAQSVVSSITQIIGKLIAMAAVAGVLSLLGFGSFSTFFKIGDLFKAHGGPVSGHNPYIVGERGPELFVPSTSGRIIANNNLGGIRGGAKQMVSVAVTGRISGRDVLLSNAREGRYQNRNV